MKRQKSYIAWNSFDDWSSLNFFLIILCKWANSKIFDVIYIVTHFGRDTTIAVYSFFNLFCQVTLLSISIEKQPSSMTFREMGLKSWNTRN